MTIQARDVLAGLGGGENTLEIEPYVARLRAKVADPTLVDPTGLRRSGCHGVVLRGQAVQLVVGPNAEALATDIGGLARSYARSNDR